MHGHTADGPLTTLTHARLRALQGDVVAARRILSEILRGRPEDVEAQALLAALSGRGPQPVHENLPEPDADAPERGSPREMAARFKRVLNGRRADPDRVLRQLEGWLERVRRNAGDAGARR
jgi:anthranilate phosphoribosyltransferase